MKGKHYQPGIGVKPPKAQVIKLAALQSAKRVETYNFKASKSLHYSDYISQEMIELKSRKFDSYAIEKSVWTDRHYIVAAPLGVDVYLNCESAMPALVLGAPRFYADDFLKHNQVPDPQRFPYSEEAKIAAKKIQFVFHQKVMKRHVAAKTLQVAFRKHEARKQLKKRVDEVKLSANRIKFLFKKRKARIKQLKLVRDHQRNNVIKIQAIWRGALVRFRRFPKGIKFELHRRKAIKLQRWIRSRLLAFRKKRGVFRRRLIHIVRLQKLFRRRKQYKEDLRVEMEIKEIAKKAWVMQFPMAVKIYRTLRRAKLYSTVVKIQKTVRMFLGKRRRHRLRLEILSAEKYRFTHEQLEIKQIIVNFHNFNKSWYEELKVKQPLPEMLSAKSGLRYTMLKLDKLASSVLNAEPASTFTCGIDLKTLSYRQRVGLAILAVFSNRPNASLDNTAWALCGNLFLPLDTHATIINDKCLNYSIKTLSETIKPLRSLMWRIKLTGHLPDVLLMKAAVLRSWQFALDREIADGVRNFRLRRPLKYACPHCLEPLIFHKQMLDHGECARNKSITWVNKDLVRPAKDLLFHTCKSLDRYLPTIDRNSFDYKECPNMEF